MVDGWRMQSNNEDVVEEIRRLVFPVGVAACLAAVGLPNVLTKYAIYPGFRLVFGTLYPAYASYKAVRTKDVKEYVSSYLYLLYTYKWLLCL